MIRTTLVSALVVFEVLSVWAIVTDLQSRRIKNLNTLLCAVLGIGTQTLLIATGTVSLGNALLCALLAVTIGVILYLASFWAPGDGKLFIGSALMIPPGVYRSHDLPTPVVMITLIFVTAAAVFLLWHGRQLISATSGFFSSVAKWKMSVDSKTINGRFRQLGKFILIFLALTGVSTVIADHVDINFGILGSLLVAMGLRWALRRYDSRYVYILLALPAAYSLYGLIYRGATGGLLACSSLAGVWIGGRVLGQAERIFAKTVTIAELAPGHFLKSSIGKQNDGTYCIVNPGGSARPSKERGFALIVGPETGPLTGRDVDLLRHLLESGALPSAVTVQRTWAVPFAPVIVFAAHVLLYRWVVGEIAHF